MSPVRLETARLVVRHAELSDVPALVRYVNENRDFLAPWEPVRPAMYYREAFWRHRLPEDVRDYHDDRALRLFLFPKDEPGEVAGAANFTNFMRGPFQACFLGYALGERFQGRGYMTEALAAAVDFVFQRLGLHRIMANYMPENQRSAGVLRRLGFEVEGVARDYVLIGGRWRDHVLTSKVNPAWRPAPDAQHLVLPE